MALCGLTNLPTSRPYWGSEVGLEPTAHRMDERVALGSLLSRMGVEPIAPDFPRLLRQSRRTYKRGRSAGRAGLSVAFGLSLCCDYSIYYLSKEVNR